MFECSRGDRNGFAIRLLAAVLFYFFILYFYLPFLYTCTHSDNIRFFSNVVHYTRTLYSFIMSVLSVQTLKILFVFTIPTLPYFIYGFSTDKLYGVLYGLWLMLFYDKFLLYASVHDSMVYTVFLTFVLIRYRSVWAIILLSLCRVENIALLIIKNRKLAIIPLLILYHFKHIIVEPHPFKMFLKYQVNDFGSFGYVLAVFGFIGLYRLSRRSETFVFMGWVMLFSFVWAYVYNHPNPRYFLQFFVLWYYFAGFEVYSFVMSGLRLKK